MKRKIAVIGLLVAVLVVVVFSETIREVKAQSLPSSLLRYESGAFGVNGGEFAAGKLVNADTVSHNWRVVIYRASGPALLVVSDTGMQPIAPGTLAGAVSPVESGALDDYTVEITTDSEKVIPAVSAQTPGCDPTCHIPRVELHGSQLTKFRQEF